MGAGHVMRSSVLAEELIALGLQVCFVGKIENMPWVKSRILEMGFSAICSSEEELLDKTTKDVLILDSYTVPVSNAFIEKRRWARVIIIADAVTPNYECDLAIYPTFSGPKTRSLATSVVSGSDYILIRKSITAIASSRQYISSETPAISVVGGGSDLNNFAREITQILRESDLSFRAKIFSSSCTEFNLDSRFECFQIGQEMEKSLFDCELGITSASTTALEFIACGVPTAIASVIDNQDDNYKNFTKLGKAFPIGNRNDLGQLIIDKTELLKIVSSSKLRRQMHLRAANSISLDGAKCIVDKILNL